MLIECLTALRSSKTRKVSMFGTIYDFTALADGRVVAEVANPEHAARFLSKPRSYREFTDKIPVPGATLQAGAAKKSAAPPAPPPPANPPAPPAGESTPPAQTEPPAPPAPPAGTDGSQTADEINAKAQALLSSTPVAIKKQVEKHPPGKEVLDAAIALEQAAKSPRQHVLACLTGARSALES